MKTPADEGALQATGVVKRRFWVLFLFASLGFLNQYQLVIFTQTIRQTQAFFDVSAFEVNVLTLTNPLGFVLLAIPLLEVMNRMGLRNVIRWGSLLNTFAALLKVAAVLWVPNYLMLLSSQFIASITSVLTMSAPPVVAMEWFAAKERGLATAVGVVVGYLGFSAGYGVPPQIVNPSHQSKDDFLFLFGSVAVLSVVNSIFTFIGFPKAPPLPPSVASPLLQPDEASFANAGEEGGKQCCDGLCSGFAVFGQLKALKSNWSFHGLVVTVALMGGFSTAVGGVIAQLAEPFGVSSAHSGLVVCGGLLLGAVLSFPIAGYATRSTQYKRTILILNGTFATLNALLAVFTTFLTGNAFLAGMAFTLGLGTGTMLPLIPVCLELLAEVTFPTPEIVASLCAQWFVNLVGVIFTFIIAAVIGNHPTKKQATYVFSIEAGCLFSAFILILLVVKEDLKRHKVELEAAGAISNDTNNYGSVNPTADGGESHA